MVGTIPALSPHLASAGTHRFYLCTPLTLVEPANLPHTRAILWPCSPAALLQPICLTFPSTFPQPRCSQKASHSHFLPQSHFSWWHCPTPVLACGSVEVRGLALDPGYQWMQWNQWACPRPRLPMALLKPVAMWSPHRGCPLITWLWWCGKPMFLDPHRTETIKETIHGGLLSPGHDKESRLKCTPSSCEKGLSTCPGASAWEGGIRLPTHLEAMEDLSEAISWWWGPSLQSPLASRQFDKTSQKGAYTLIWSPIFAIVAQGIPQDLLVWRPAGIMIVAPQDYIYLHSLKDAAWKSGFQSAWI